MRESFVSNSSSTSFIIRDQDISIDQAHHILYHQTLEGDTRWHVRQELGYIVGTTTAHCYDMESYLRNLDISDSNVLWINT